ncbi:MAG: hypothetical protein WED34_04790 [Planctomycetales bacterium]
MSEIVDPWWATWQAIVFLWIPLHMALEIICIKIAVTWALQSVLDVMARHTTILRKITGEIPNPDAVKDARRFAD